MLPDTQAAALAAIGLTPALRRHIQALGLPPTAPFLRRVTEVQRDALTLHDGEHEHPARLLPALHLSHPPHDGLAVGDWVHAARDVYGRWWVHASVPPLNQLARRQHDGRQKSVRAVIVSNVDTALLVMGLDHDFNLRRLERYLALARLSAVEPVVVLTKADLCDPVYAERRLQEVCAALPPGVDALALDATGDEARSALARWTLPGHTLVLLGSSGAGKSTLTNALLGEHRQDTGASRAGDSRGRHTTTARSLHALPGGACIIDTPGLRTLRLDADVATLSGVFDEIAQGALHCRFRDCRHQGEPGCAVRDQVAPERLRNFHKMARELQRDAMSALQRKEQRQQWKSRHRAARERDRDKRGDGP